MAYTLHLKRGKEEQREKYTPEESEPVFCMDTGKLYIGDGKTPGGIEVKDYKGDWKWNLYTVPPQYVVKDFSNFKHGFFIGFCSGLTLLVVVIIIVRSCL